MLNQLNWFGVRSAVNEPITDEAGKEVARGLAAYDAEEARRIAGHRSSEIEAILGYEPRAAMIHRDDMVVV